MTESKAHGKDKPIEGELIEAKVGRPSKYSPDMCNELVALMEKGWTNTRICAKWSISRDTFYRWLKEKDDFKAAFDEGIEKAEAWWEEIGISGMLGQLPKFNATLYLATMNNKFGWSRDSKGGKTQNTQINIENMNVVKDLSDSELQTRIETKLKVLGIESTDGEDSNKEG